MSVWGKHSGRFVTRWGGGVDQGILSVVVYILPVLTKIVSFEGWGGGVQPPTPPSIHNPGQT